MKAITDLSIAVLAGGPGSEREVSLASGKGVVEALSSRCKEARLLDVTGFEVELPEDIDLGFNVIHGTFGEDGQLQEQLDRKGQPYTGAGAASSRLAFDKIASKERFIEHKVATPAYRLIRAENAKLEDAETAVRSEASQGRIKRRSSHRENR